ncbi:hypothetical protein SteCoe_26950 [Stentor coeruleus]|uniref:TNFR-Cys domain-containing protein n=1 Tax=Stentor coeruleus TaxID=5963 RepID=A0A1R2BBZ7_9CILI|nr:hypothetical protein SteCoe_26950 [Stentor coeruleus]
MLILLVNFIFLPAIVQSLGSLSLSFTPQYISSQASYTIIFAVGVTTPATSTVKLTFPSEVTIADSSSVACTISSLYNPTSSGVSCSVASKVFTVNGVFGVSGGDDVSSSPMTMTIILPLITNPATTKTTSPVALATYNPSGSLLESTTTSTELAITASPASLTSASISPSSTVIGASTSWVFSITTSYTIPVGAILQITFPYWNSNIGATSASDLLHVIRITSPSCSATSNMDSPLTGSYSTSTKYLTITGGFTSTKTGTSSFTVSSVYNPPTSDSLLGFIVKVLDSSSYEYLTSSTLSVQVTTANTVDIKSSYIIFGNSTVSTSGYIYVTFVLTNPTYSGVLVDILIPSEFTYDSGMVASGFTNIATTLTYTTVATNTIRITNGFISYAYKTSITIKLDPLTTPSSTKATSTFTITTRSPNANSIDSGSGASVTAKAGTIYQYFSNSLVTASDLTVGATTTYTFDMMLSHIIPSGACLIITFPTEISITDRDSSTSCTSIIAGLDSAAKCQVVSKVLTVIGGFPSGFSPNRISFSIDKVTNPTTTAVSSTFTWKTTTDSTALYTIDQKTSGITFTAVTASLVSASVTPSSLVTGVVTTYTFIVVTKNIIPINGYIKVTFPSCLSISDTTNAASTCTKIQGFTSSTLTCTATSSSLTVNGFSSGSFSAGTLEWSINYTKNPSSTATCSTFQINTYDSSNYSIDQKTSGISVTVTTANTLSSVIITPGSYINGQSCTYTFTIKVTNITPTNAYAIIEAPSQVTLPATPTCAVGSGISTIACSYSSSTSFKAIFTFSTSTIASETSITFTLNSVINPGTTKTSDTFKAYTYTTDGYKIDMKDTGITVATTTAATISTMVIAAADSKIAASTSYTISYLPVNSHPAGTVIFVTIPSEFIIGTLSCTAVTISSSATCLINSRTVTVNSGFPTAVAAASTVSFTLNGFTNPSTMITTSVWTVSSVTSDNYLIDTSTTVKSTFTCDTLCLTCSGLPSTCISCDTSGAYPYLYSASCHASCLDGYYDDSTTNDKLCEACNSLCKTCSGSAIYCTSCVVGSSYPYLYSNTCNTNCLAGYWGDGTNCYVCTNPCKTCTSSTACATCAVSTITSLQTYLLSTTCYDDCPSAYTEDTSANTCIACTGLCATCSTTASTCTSCVSPYKLQSTSCVSACIGDGTYIDSGTVCSPCISPCYTCTTNTVTCTTCVSGYYLFETSCTQTCPPGYIGLSSKCVACASPCKYCLGSTMVCTACIDTYLLQINTCVLSCSSGYYSDGINCLACNSNCATCSVTSTYCLSCYTPNYLLSNQCVSSCPSGTYVPTTGICLACESPCATCSGSVTNCVTCPTGMLLYSGTCLSSCPSGVSVLVGSTCEACNTKCLTCSGTVDTCTSCSSSLYLQSGSCVDSCSFGYIIIGTECKACNSNCFSCSGTTNYCISCNPGYYLYQNACYNPCPEGYVASLSVCVEITDSGDCNSGCTASILSNNDCDAVCNVDACSYDNGNCNIGAITCGSGYYELNNMCYPCSYPCSNCLVTASTCTGCQEDKDTGDPLYLYNNECYTQCPSKTMLSLPYCIDCDIRCASCALSASTCLTCVSPYLLYNNQCIVSCLDGITVQSGDICIDCSGNCKTCSGTYSTCTSCNSPKVLQGSSCNDYCNSGYYADSSGICQLCVNCKECSGTSTTCTSCNSGYYLYLSKCYSVCPIGTYTSLSTCELCLSNCAICSMAGSCDVCNSGYSLLLTECTEICPENYDSISGICVVSSNSALCSSGCDNTLLSNDKCDILCNYALCNYDELDCSTAGSCSYGKYLDGSTCKDCIYPCKECTSQSSCRACPLSVTTGDLLLLKDSTCIEPSTCTSGYTKIGVFCEKCDSNCAECSGAVDTCVSCEDNIYLYNGECIASCPSLITVIVGTFCVDCNSNCATCTSTVSTCTSCISGKVLQGTSCLDSCNSGYTTTLSFPKTCIACTGDCVTCSQETTSCTSCISGKYLYGTSCVANCAADITILQGTTCLSCTSPCLTCSGSVTTCVICISGYSLFGSECLDKCPDGYEPRLGVCEPYCHEGCTSTMLYNLECDIFCNNDACLWDNTLCLESSTCVAGEYQSGSECLTCVSPCNTCASIDYCTSCVVDTNGVSMLLYDGECYTSCPPGTYKSGLSCLVCDSTCYTCTGTSTYCTSCSSTLKLYNGKCVTTCPSGTTIEISSTCYDCDNTCKTCSGSIDNCTACPTGTVLSSGDCIPECPSGYTTTDTSNGICIACTGCLTCLSSTTYCTSCVNGEYLHENQCLTSCPSGYAPTTSSPNTCSKCSSNCAECKDTISYCIACVEGLSLSSSHQCQVAATCPDGQTTTPEALTVCSKCTSPCKTCQDSQTYCTSCNSDYYLTTSNTCILCDNKCLTCETSAAYCTSCVDGKYVTTSNTCQDCTVSCATCVGLSTTCTSCPSGLFLENSLCLECDNNCKDCETSAANCISCEVGYYLIGNKCYQCNSNCYTCVDSATKCSSCVPGKYVNSNFICTDCGSECAECEGSSTLCTACDSPMVLINNKCDVCLSSCETCVVAFDYCATCLTGLTLIDGVCKECSNNCLTCSGTFSTCLSCDDGRYLSGTSCPLCSSTCKTCEVLSTKCTSCYDGKSLINNECVTCNSPCITCQTDKDTCTSCSDDNYLSNSKCYACDSTCTKCFSSPTTCTECVDGYYVTSNQCKKCSDLCVTCEIDSTKCTSCIETAKLTNGVCKLDCEPGTLQIGLSCEPCSPSCLTCSGAVDICSSCASGIVYQNDCVDSCPVGYYATNGGCQPCATICKECEKTSTSCITCNLGYRLKGTTCEYVCPPGQFSDGGVCQPCDEKCNTCYGTSIFCTSCSNSTDVLMSDGVCVEPCDSGYVRLSSSEPCIQCDSTCKECILSTKNCTSCSTSSNYLYQGSCIPSCPDNITVAIGKKCFDCSSNCEYCSISPYNCTQCFNNTYLYYTTCTKNCPSGYKINDIYCEKCYNPNNCSEIPPSSSNSSNTTNSTIVNPTFDAQPVPFPISGISFVSAGILGVTKITAASVQFVPSTIALWGGLSLVSWVFVTAYIPDQGTNGDYRRLTEVDAVGGDITLTVAFFLFIGALVFHFVCNILFSITYVMKVYRKDSSYIYWKKRHSKINLISLILTFNISFHCIRLLFCGLCNYDGFKAIYDKKKKLYKPLIKYGYISLLCTFVPIFIANLLVLSELDTGRWLWMFSLDSLLITFFLAVLIYIDIRRREKELILGEFERFPLEGEDLIGSAEGLKELIDGFPDIDFSRMIPTQSFRKKLRKCISKSNPASRVSSPVPSEPPSSVRELKRRGSFPLMATDFIEINPESIKPKEVTPPDIIEEPFNEGLVEKFEAPEDITMIQDESLLIHDEPVIISEPSAPSEPRPPTPPPEPKEFEIAFTEYKESIIKPSPLIYMPVDIEPRAEEFTEIVAYTEEDVPSEEEQVIPKTAGDDKVEEFEVDHEVNDHKRSEADLLKDSSSKSIENFEEKKSEDIIEPATPGQKDLGTISEEKDLDLEKAVADPSDPELVKVFHKESGQRITVRKGFKGARIVDLENKIIDTLAPIDTNKYEISKTIVDDNDVHFATMTARTGEKVRVKRSFKGARILDLEKKVAHPNAYLIGQTIKNESDFQFSNAYPDPEDPEVVVVMHNETGEDVKIRKTFHGATVVDEAGEPVPDAPAIDRNDYDIPKTIVDKEDVHLATLKHKITKAKVKVRRNFRGAKIIDLERKADIPIRALPSVMSEKSDEPEPLSPELSQDDLMGNEMGWITPSYPRDITPKMPMTKKPPLKPIAITPKNDESGYDRKKLANLANLIDDLEEEYKEPQQPEPFRYVSDSSDDDKSMTSIKPQRKTMYHNVDLDTVYAPEFRDEGFEQEGFPIAERKKGKKKRKKAKKIPPADPARMKGLEDIYLQRLEGKKKLDKSSPLKFTDQAFFEPEWERTESVFENKYIDRTLPNAGEEIINPRFKVSTPRRDF